MINTNTGDTAYLELTGKWDVVLPALMVPEVAAADEAAPSVSETAIQGAFNNGEDITRPRNLFQVRQR